MELKKLICFVLTLLLLLPMAAGAAADDASKAWLETIWKAQTINGLDSGVWVIPEEAINQFFAVRAEDSASKLKNPELKILGGNNVYIAFDSKVGRVGITGEIKRFVHDQTESYAEVYVTKKEIANQPVLTWMLKFIPMGALADLYGNPLKDAKQVDAKFSGNTLKVNFRPLIEKSLLGNDIGKKVEIKQITTREAALELHTNIKAADVLGLIMGF